MAVNRGTRARNLVAGALVALAAATTPAIAPAQAVAEVKVPEPAQLSADWWLYFEPADGSREERVESLQARLDVIAGSLTQVGAGEDRVRGLIVEVSDLSERYLDVSSRTAPEPEPVPPVAESYTIEQLMALAASRRELEFERDLDREDVERTARLLTLSASRIDDAKAAYLALPEAAPERLERGLELMRSQFVQSVNEADLRVRRVALARIAERVEQLAAEREYASKNIRVEPDEPERWADRAARAREDKERLEEEAGNARLRSGSFGDDAQERARRRRLEQRLIEFEARIVSSELVAIEADLAGQLAIQLSAPGPGTLEALRAKRDALTDSFNRLESGLDIWRRATDRERSAAMAQLADAQDSSLADLHRSRIARADETGQHINDLSRLLAEGRTLARVAGVYIVDESGVTSDLWRRAVDGVEDVWVLAREWSGRSLFSINETPVTPVGLVRVVVILVVAWWVSHLLRRGLDRLMLHRETMSRASLYTLGRLSHYVILVVAFMIALSSVGIDFTKLALFVSALGVGLGFGLQAIFSNFVAGLIILFEKSLKVGDFVELESGLTGEVREINIRGTLVTTNDNIDILVPNSEFVNGRVTNWTLREAHRRTRVPFGVAYGTDKDLVRQAVLEAANSVPFTLTSATARAPQVWLVGFGDSSLDFELVVWLTQDAVKRPGAVHAAYCWAIESALGANGIEIPFPQRDLHIRSYLGHKDSDGPGAIGPLGEQLPPAAASPTG